MNCYSKMITTFCLLFFNMFAVSAEIGFIQDNKGRKWSVFQDKNIMFAERDNEKVEVAPYIPYKTSKWVSSLNYKKYVLYFADAIRTGDKSLLVLSEKILEEVPTIYK